MNSMTVSTVYLYVVILISLFGARKYGGKQLTEYLVRWKGWGPEWDLWYGEDLLEDAKERTRI